MDATWPCRCIIVNLMPRGSPLCIVGTSEVRMASWCGSSHLVPFPCTWKVRCACRSMHWPPWNMDLLRDRSGWCGTHLQGRAYSCAARSLSAPWQGPVPCTGKAFLDEGLEFFSKLMNVTANNHIEIKFYRLNWLAHSIKAWQVPQRYSGGKSVHVTDPCQMLCQSLYMAQKALALPNLSIFPNSAANNDVGQCRSSQQGHTPWILASPDQWKHFQSQQALVQPAACQWWHLQSSAALLASDCRPEATSHCCQTMNIWI